jgi:hypothetical protein
MLSVVSWFVFPFNATYCASKHAALALTEGVRMQLKAQGTQVVAVYAGFIDTDMAAGFDREKTPLRQVAERTLDGIRNGLNDVHADEISPFGGSLAGGLFAGFDGGYNTTGVDNATDDLVYLDPAIQTWQIMIDGSQMGTGHPIGLLAADGTLYVANFNLNGDPSQPGQTWQGGTGDIIAITESVPEPGSALLLLVGTAAVYSRARVRRGRFIN